MVPDVLTALMWSATLKKAAALEQFLLQHKEHYPGVTVAFANDNLQSHASCSCGASFEVTVTVSLSVRSTAK